MFKYVKVSLWMGLGVLALALLAAPATAQYDTHSQVNNRLHQLENQIQTLSRAVFRGDVTPPPVSSGSASSSVSQQTGSIANLEIRLSQIEQQLQQLTGQLEEQQYRLEQLARGASAVSVQQQQPAFSQSPQGSVPQRGLPQGTHSQTPTPQTNNGFQNTTTTIPAQTLLNTAPTSPSSPNTNAGFIATDPNALYEKSFVEIRDGHYDAAEQGFQSFLNTYPDHKLAANAHYWLAETYYVRGNYTEAAKRFARGYQDYPKSTKVADNLLKLGLSLSKLGKTQDACLTLNQLQTQFSSETGPVMRRAKQETERLGCG